MENLNAEIRISGNELFNTKALIHLPMQPIKIKIKIFDKENEKSEFGSDCVECVMYPLQPISDELRIKIVNKK